MKALRIKIDVVEIIRREITNKEGKHVNGMTGLDGKKGITDIFFCGSMWRFQGKKNTDSDTRKTPKKRGKAIKKLFL